MTLEIKKYPDPILRKKAEEIKEITQEIKKICQDIAETIIENQGIGLAAPQVGELKRIIVVQTEKGGEENLSSSSPTERGEAERRLRRDLFLRPAAARLPEVFINPKIIKKSKEIEIGEEGCLSFPDLFLKIKRAKRVEIEALNMQGKKIQIKVECLTARVFQHEIDHLDGILFIDRISFWQRLRARNKLKKL